ncbi:MAG: helix-turn-helix transcriptional regulator [Lentisphaerae bacterium]|nr:helix-turn-helix transcriptional regulator [Lentisphaerota bacterium]MCP4103619.1 helix-turn-helix transcriptional regulator [Lentisphaerota bacterium]
MKILNNQTSPNIFSDKPEIVFCGQATVTANHNPSFQLNNWSLLLFNYNGRIQLGNEFFDHHPGCLFLTAPNVFKHHFPAEDSYHLFVQIDFKQRSEVEDTYLLIDLEEAYHSFLLRMQEMLIYHQSDPVRASIRLWDLLQQLKDCGGHGTLLEPLPLRKAVEYIETHLHKTIEIGDIPAYCEVSQSYLTRLFHKYRSQTIIGWIRQRRLELAHAMLINSNQSIKEIAAAVGIPDLHYFNKCIKSKYMYPPRTIRRMQ